ncbi:MAG: hypothetical protein ACOCX3_03795 [Chloroflexota bacterium]
MSNNSADGGMLAKLAESYLREQGLLDTDDAFAIDAELDKFAEWKAANRPGAKDISGTFEDFKHWVTHWRGVPQRVDGAITLHVSITRNYGPVVVALGETSDWYLSDFSEQLKATQIISEKLWRMHDDWVRSTGARMGVDKNASQTTTTTAASATVTETADEITVNLTNGKRLYRVKGGRYSTWGVPIYPEVLRASGYDNPEAQIPDAGLKISGNFTVEIIDGKPKRVLSLSVN